MQTLITADREGTAMVTAGMMTAGVTKMTADAIINAAMIMTGTGTGTVSATTTVEIDSSKTGYPASTQCAPTRYVIKAHGLSRKGVKYMNKIIAGFVAGLFSVGIAYAQAPAATAPAAKAEVAAPAASGCEAKAVSKSGKPLAGAAKTAFIKKCEGGSATAPSSCATKAVGKNGKPLAGAAKTAFMKKCEADAK